MRDPIRRAFAAIISLFLAMALSGCATSRDGLSLDHQKLREQVMALTGCTSTTDCRRAMHTADELDDERISASGEDPWEGFNRSMYKFNYRLDKYLLLPVVGGYEFITPTVV